MSKFVNSSKFVQGTVDLIPVADPLPVADLLADPSSFQGPYASRGGLPGKPGRSSGTSRPGPSPRSKRIGRKLRESPGYSLDKAVNVCYYEYVKHEHRGKVQSEGFFDGKE